MSLSKYFKFPFALSGDRAAVPDATQPSGEVSFEEGYGIDYQLDPATEPSAKNIERDKANQLYYDITQAIKEYQEFGVPYWIEAAQNGEVSFPYPKYALVRYDIGGGETPVFQSLVDANTALPTVTTNWQRLSSANPFIVDSAAFEASVANGEIVYWDSANNRFDEAVADGTAAQNAIGMADVSNARVFLFGSVPAGVISGLAGGVPYYLSPVTPGAITNVRPATNAIQVGVGKSATTIFINISAPYVNTVATPAQFDSSTLLANTAFVQRAIGNFASSAVYATTQTLTAADTGKLVALGGGSPYTVTLPLLSALPNGAAINLKCDAGASVTITRQGADVINVNSTTVTSIILGSGDSLFLVKDGAQWRSISGTGQLKYSAAFGSLLSANGYQKLPSGVIVQWGQTASIAGGGGTSGITTFPIAFPTACDQVVFSPYTAPNAGSTPSWVDSKTASNFSIRNQNGVAASFGWLAVGR